MPAPRWSTVLLIVCLAPAAAACSSPPPPPPAPSLAGTTWQLVEIQSMDDSQGLTKVSDPGKYTVTFGDDGRATFRIDCNRGNGSWETEAGEDGQSGSLTFGPIATTMMACPPPTIDQKVSTALPMVRGYLVKDNRLHMSQFADGDTLTWEPV